MNADSTFAATRVGPDPVAAARDALSAAMEEQVGAWASSYPHSRDVVDEAWRVLSGRPVEIADADGIRVQVMAIAADCLAWRLLDLRATTGWAFESLVAMYGLQLRGMIRAVAGVLDDSEIADIAQEVWVAVWLTPPVHRADSVSLTPFRSWLRAVAGNKTRTYLTRRSSGQRPRGNRDDKGPIEWLLEQTHGGGMPVQIAVVAGLHAYCDLDAETIARSFGDQPLRGTISSLRQHQPLALSLDPLYALLESEQGRRPLKEFCKDAAEESRLASCVERWIQDAATIARNLRMDGAPSSSASPVDTPSEAPADPWKAAMLKESVKIVLSDDREPHATLCYVLNRFLQLKPEQILNSESSTRLDDLVAARSIDLAGQFPFISEEEWAGCFAPLRAALDGPTARGARWGELRLRDFFQTKSAQEQAREIGLWVRDVDRRFRSAVHDDEEVFLQAVFNCRGLVCTKLAFAFHGLLRVPADYLPWLAHVTADSLTIVFLAAYGRDGEANRRLAQGRLEKCLVEFRSSLARPARALVEGIWDLAVHFSGVAKTGGFLTFHDFLSSSSRSGRKDELLAWTATIRSLVLYNLKRKQAGLIYAYVHAGF